MTFEDLLASAAEQRTRIFEIECNFEYIAHSQFNVNHFKLLSMHYINNACWETLVKMEFPFEKIISNVDHVHTVHTNSSGKKVFSGVSFKFSTVILNEPKTKTQDIARLPSSFVFTYDEILVNTFKIPFSVKTASISIDVSKSHTLYPELKSINLI